MSVAAQRALRSAIDQKKFEPVYYLHGEDEFRKDDAVSQLIGAATDPATRDFNLDLLRGNEVDAARLTVAVDALPMLAERRVVVLRDVGSLKKAARAALDRYLAAPARETLLVLTSPAGAKADAEVIARATSVAFVPLDDDKVAPWLMQHARKLGSELGAESAALIAEAVHGDLAHGVGELDKLLSFTNGRTIEPADVEAIVGVRRGETLGDLLDAVAARDARAGAALVEPVLAQPKNGAVPLVMSLTVQTLAMAWGRAARDAGLPAQRLEGEFIRLFSAARAWPGRSYGEAAKCCARNLPKWNAEELKRAMARLLATDVALKDSRVSSDGAVITALVLSLCAPTPRRVAA